MNHKSVKRALGANAAIVSIIGMMMLVPAAANAATAHPAHVQAVTAPPNPTGKLLVGGGAAGAAIASGPVTPGVVHACYVTQATPTGGHALVLQNAGTTCPWGTTALTWNQHGPAGPGLLAWAYVNANGTAARSSGNVTVANPDPGLYCIGVTGGTAHVAVASLDSLENTGGTVQAGVFAASICPANASNIYVVTRPQSQDGGFPGVNHAFYIIVS